MSQNPFKELLKRAAAALKAMVAPAPDPEAEPAKPPAPKEREYKSKLTKRMQRNGARLYHKDGAAAMDALVQRFRGAHVKRWNFSDHKRANDLAMVARRNEDMKHGAARAAFLKALPDVGKPLTSPAIERKRRRQEERRAAKQPFTEAA